MGDNTLSVAEGGKTIPAAHHNGIVQALDGDLVPRNTSRVAEDLAGSLGTSLLRFLRAYAQEFRIGSAAENLRIFEGATGEIWIENDANNTRIKLRTSSIVFEVAGVIKTYIDANGSNGAYLKTSSVPRSALTAKTVYQNTVASVSIGGSTFVTGLDTNFSTTSGRKYIVTLSIDSASFTGVGNLTMLIGATVYRNANPVTSTALYMQSMTFVFTAPATSTYQARISAGSVNGANWTVIVREA